MRWPRWAKVSPGFWFQWHWKQGDFTPSGAVAYWRTNTAGTKALILVDALLFVGLIALFAWFAPGQNG